LIIHQAGGMICRRNKKSETASIFLLSFFTRN